MLARTRHHTRARRGIVLVLVLAMLGLLALIGVTFATFSGQARINARLFALSVVRPQDDELMDFALQQLITDTGDPRSAIRGHSLARDMFGNDASNNGYLPINPQTGLPPKITKINPAPTVVPDIPLSVPSRVNGTPPNLPPLLWDVETDIPVPTQNPALYGYDFTRWIMRVSFTVTMPSGSPQAVSQTFEVLVDDYLPNHSNTQYSGNGFHAFRISPLDSVQAPHSQTLLNNPTLGFITNTAQNPSPFPGWTAGTNNAAQMALSQVAFNAGNLNLLNFTLDGRWLRAFNGPGMGALNVIWPDPITGGNITNPLSTYGNFRYNLPLLQLAATQYAQRNGLANPPILTDPNSLGMDEDYDACDLENWFLAIQSADGQVMIPSFHRPGVIRYQDPANSFDWSPAVRFPNGIDAAPNYDSVARILRPVAADGHDQATFPDLTPDPTTGKITYDVDNDGDGIADSVWLDLGYPAHRDATGNLYKPLFAFMVIGLNGRIPLNTAGNLAGAGATHAAHLGNSVSEIDPTYLLQNAYQGAAVDADPFNVGAGSAQNTQVDNAGFDVRLTQLRNLLAGTRPQINPTQGADTTVNGDANFVLGSWPDTLAGRPYFMPNSVADGFDTAYTSDGAGNPLVQRTTPPVAGRWGEAASIPGVPFNSTTPPLNLVQSSYRNLVRAGYSFDIADMVNNASYGNIPFPRDAADDNFNAFDVYPNLVTNANRVGEIYDLDFYDAAGALMLPVERMRRFVTPVDINGTGQVQTWRISGPNKNFGSDPYGRVAFSSYFRPAGVAGPINVPTSGTTYSLIGTNYPYGSIAPPVLNGGAVGGFGTWHNGSLTPWGPGHTSPWTGLSNNDIYLPDVTNNPLHGYEWYKVPNRNQIAGVTTAAPGYNPSRVGGMPVTPVGSTSSPPTTLPSYTNLVNSQVRSDGVNEADEMNLYSPNPLLDSPYGPSDLEWLYRQQDVDGLTMTSRLAQLAPISFTNTIDGLRRRRLVALDSWETNNFAWTTDNPGGAFANNARFTPLQDASMVVLSANRNGGRPGRVTTPSLAHRDKKINLNYPLPVSNDPNEPVRQRWITDTYQLLKAVLPPTSIDSAEELVQLSQFIINIIDFRDPDSTMTRWRNPDVILVPSTSPTTYPTLTLSPGSGNFRQYGMEYNPVAINEVLAYGLQSRPAAGGGGVTTAQYTNRIFVELVNTLTAAYNPQFNYTARSSPNNYYGYGPISQSTSTTPTGGNIPTATTPPFQASTLDLGGFSYTSTDPYSGACWDLVFTADNPMARPDPYRGDLVNTAVAGSFFGLIPLNRDSVTTATTGGNNPNAPNNGDVTLIPLAPTANNPANPGQPPINPVPPPIPPTTTPPTPPTNYFYVIGSQPTGNEGAPIQIPTSTTQTPTVAGGPLPLPLVTQYLTSSFDPLKITGFTPPTMRWYPGILPGATTAGPPRSFSWKYPQTYTAGSKPSATPTTAQYLWVCLRRPANLFAPVSANNPMIVVDSMRFPYIDGTASPGLNWTGTPPVPPAAGASNGLSGTTIAPNTIYSAQRLQPYRGGHAVPMPSTLTTTGTANIQGAMTTSIPPDPRYGYTEQIAVPQTSSGTYGYANVGGGTGTPPASTNYIYHTLGNVNDSAENWDYFPFNDRDFSSVAELLLVPGCPPGLFTKQFAEFAPSQVSAANIFGQVTPVITPTSSVGTWSGTPPTPNLLQKNAAQSANAPYTTNYPIVPFFTASVPFLSVSEEIRTSALGYNPTAAGPLPAYVPPFYASGTITPPNVSQPTPPTTNPRPILPHTFPYLVDKFFYTGASTFYYPPNNTALDPGSPSNPTPVPVVGGPGGDGWFKMLEFFEVPSQMIGAIGPVAQGANFDWARQDLKPGLMNLNLIIDEEAFFGVFGSQNNSDQNLLNSIELPLLITHAGVKPYSMPLATNNNGAPPIPLHGPPVPLVVSAIQPTGGPNYVYPITDQTRRIQHGYLAVDPIGMAIYNASGGAYPVGNRIKAAFAQFLWARHGGSGYVFGYGNGVTGHNSSVATPGVTNYSLSIPAERPFRSLSYPDIDHTIMRPAALPPSTISMPAMSSGNPASNAQNHYTTQTATAGKFDFLSSTLFYSPFVRGALPYTGDPGVRNPFLNQGYVTSQTGVSSPYPVSYSPGNMLPAGVPIPTNVAIPTTSSGVVLAAGIAMPPPIPPARLFQVPDAYGSGRMQAFHYPGNGTVVPPAVSNATDSGDPWINNFVANQALNPGVPPTPSYTLNNGFTSLAWSGGLYFSSASPTPPLLTATGVLPTTSINYLPYPANPPVLANLVPSNGYGAGYNANAPSPDLGAAAVQTISGFTYTDNRQHPYWRTEMLQKAMNLTTVRTHQYAVWITVGFFEVKRQGDIAMLAQGLPQLAFDVMGPEVGALTGSSVRYRGFFLVDRLKLNGFNPSDPGAFHGAVVYRKVIQ